MSSRSPQSHWTVTFGAAIPAPPPRTGGSPAIGGRSVAIFGTDPFTAHYETHFTEVKPAPHSAGRRPWVRSPALVKGVRDGGWPGNRRGTATPEDPAVVGRLPGRPRQPR